jgi:hypothetical protein
VEVEHDGDDVGQYLLRFAVAEFAVELPAIESLNILDPFRAWRRHDKDLVRGVCALNRY